MIRFDAAFLAEAGLAVLPPASANRTLKHYYEELERRTGLRLAERMSDSQLDEFEQFFNAKDDAGAFSWLETNFPDYPAVVRDEYERLKAEVSAQAPAIVAIESALAFVNDTYEECFAALDAVLRFKAVRRWIEEQG